jgi:hypothetical protein
MKEFCIFCNKSSENTTKVNAVFKQLLVCNECLNKMITKDIIEITTVKELFNNERTTIYKFNKDFVYYDSNRLYVKQCVLRTCRNHTLKNCKRSIDMTDTKKYNNMRLL